MIETAATLPTSLKSPYSAGKDIDSGCHVVRIFDDEPWENGSYVPVSPCNKLKILACDPKCKCFVVEVSSKIWGPENSSKMIIFEGKTCLVEQKARDQVPSTAQVSGHRAACAMRVGHATQWRVWKPSCRSCHSFQKHKGFQATFQPSRASWGHWFAGLFGL